MKGWIGVDLDGTLAHYDKFVSPDHIGEPIPEMVKRVKQWIAEGKTVKIFTSRVSHPNQMEVAIVAIREWSKRHIGQVLEITCYKDYGMVELYDDRCKQVIKNTGKLLEDDLKEQLQDEYDNGYQDGRDDDMSDGFTQDDLDSEYERGYQEGQEAILGEDV